MHISRVFNQFHLSPFVLNSVFLLIDKTNILSKVDDYLSGKKRQKEEKIILQKIVVAAIDIIMQLNVYIKESKKL